MWLLQRVHLNESNCVCFDYFGNLKFVRKRWEIENTQIND